MRRLGDTVGSDAARLTASGFLKQFALSLDDLRRHAGRERVYGIAFGFQDGRWSLRANTEERLERSTLEEARLEEALRLRPELRQSVLRWRVNRWPFTIGGPRESREAFSGVNAVATAQELRNLGLSRWVRRLWPKAWIGLALPGTASALLVGQCFEALTPRLVGNTIRHEITEVKQRAIETLGKLPRSVILALLLRAQRDEAPRWFSDDFSLAEALVALIERDIVAFSPSIAAAVEKDARARPLLAFVQRSARGNSP